MTFDCILANPPYQDPNGTNKLYHQFFKLSKELMEETGHIGFICPSSFVYRTGQKNKDLRELTQGKMTYLDLTTSKHFPKVGDDICAFVYSNNHTLTEVKHEIVTLQDLRDLENLKLDKHFNKKTALIKKYKSTLLPTLTLKNDSNLSVNEKVNGKTWISKVQDEEYKYPLVQTASQEYFSNLKFKTGFNTKKIVINFSGYYYKEDSKDKYIFKSTSFVGKGMRYIQVEDDTKANNIISFLTSKLYRWFVENEKTSGFNTGVKYLKHLDDNVLWSDELVYDVFNLTVEEIELVESYFSKK